MLVQSSFAGLPSLLNRLGDQNIQRVLVEGGPTTIHRFLEDGLVDEFYLVQSQQEHKDPVPSNITADLLAKSGLKSTERLVWGDEHVERFTRTSH